MRDSNSRLSGCKPDALTTELTILVEQAGVEPAIACLQSKCIPVVLLPLVELQGLEP